MTDYAGGNFTSHVTAGAVVPDWVAASKARTGGVSAIVGIIAPISEPAAGTFSDSLPKAKPSTNWNCFDEIDTGPALHWFEDIHYTPQEISLGNMLSTVTQEIEIYNSYRRTAQTLTSATNNAGGGITFDGLPSLPTEIQGQQGLVFDAVISLEGPPTILGTLDFVTDPANISIPISGSRVVMFAWQPEAGIMETLEWKTDILIAADGTEQRIAWRKNPRQSISMTVRMEEGGQRRKLMTLLKGWHARVFGVPIWWESRSLRTDLAAGATNIPIDTSYADYREGGLVILWTDPDTFDAVSISAVNANSLDLVSPLSNDYVALESLVMPLRVATLGPTLPIQRYLNALQDVRLDWLVTDNDVGDSFGDATAFDTHNSKVLLDGYNASDGPIPDDLFRKIETFDSEIGPRSQFSDQLADVPVTSKGFYGGSRQAIWETRRLVHALRGSQKSFYLPTFYDDLVPTEGLTSSSTNLRVENIGYTDYVGGVEPFKSVWIELTDGTILTRQITAAEVIDSTAELLTVDSAWAADVALADIAKISLLRLVRIAGDTVEFAHSYPGEAQIKMSVRGAP